MSFTVLETIFKVGFAYRTMCFTIVIIGVLSVCMVYGAESRSKLMITYIEFCRYVYRLYILYMRIPIYVCAETKLYIQNSIFPYIYLIHFCIINFDLINEFNIITWIHLASWN
jgi:hypothetical protein